MPHPVRTTLVLLALAAGLVAAPWQARSALRTDAAAVTVAPTLRLGPVRLSVDGFASWAFLDRRTGALGGAPNRAARSSTESMIKPWIVADYLRIRVGARRPAAAELRAASRAIVWSDDRATQLLYRRGGGTATIDRLVRRCALRDTYAYPGWWSRTQMSARDAARMGDCLVAGTAAGPRWTGWVLREMRQVRGGVEEYRPWWTWGGGRWGIVAALPPAVAARTGVKNGWTRIGDDPVDGVARDDSWHVNCLAVHPEWVLAVLLRYPASYPLEYGAARCGSVARQFLAPRPTAAGTPAGPHGAVGGPPPAAGVALTTGSR